MKKITNQEMLDAIGSAKKNRKSIVHITDKSKLSNEDKMKLGLCKHFVRFMNKRRILPKEFADLLGLPKSRMSEIINYKISKFSIEKLIKNLEILALHDPNIKAYLEVLTTATEIPAPSISFSKRIVKEFKEASIHP